MLTRLTSAVSIIMIIVMVASFVSSVEAVSQPDVVVTSVYWGINPVGGTSVCPGDTNIPLSIVLSNAGDAAAREVNAKLVLTPPFSYVYKVNGTQVSAKTVDQSAGDMQAGFSFTVRFALSVASDATAGVHRLTIILDYKTRESYCLWRRRSIWTCLFGQVTFAFNMSLLRLRKYTPATIRSL